MKLKSKALLSIVALAASAVLATAQDANNNNNNNNGGQGGRGGDRGGRGNFNPEEFRARMEEGIKKQLKVTDDEWAVLKPLIEKVTAKQSESGRGGFGGGGFGGRGGDRGGNNGGNGGITGGTERPGSAERAALRTALEAESTPAEDLKAKLEAVRAFRKKSAAELATAREDLKKVVTVRQEAVLVSMGILE